MLLLDAGNVVFGGDKVSRTVRGAALIDGMNLLGYQAMNLAGEDAGWGLDVARQRAAEAKFPMISANVVVSGTQQPLFEPYTVIQVDGVPIAILGLADTEVPREYRRPLPSGEVLDYLDPIETTRKHLPEMQKRADIIIVLSHLGFEADVRLAKGVEGIDVILGGLSRKWEGVPYTPPGTQTVISQAGYRGEWIGRLDLQFDAEGRITAQKGGPVPLEAQYTDDPDMATLLLRWADRAQQAQATRAAGQ